MLGPNTDRVFESAVFTKEVSDEALELVGWWDFVFLFLAKSARSERLVVQTNPSTRLAQLACSPICFEDSESDQIGIKTFHRLRVFYRTAHCTSRHRDRHQVRSAAMLRKIERLSRSGEIPLRFSGKSPPVPGIPGPRCCKFDFTMRQVSGLRGGHYAIRQSPPNTAIARSLCVSRNSIGGLK
jgi:hypothetical protein